MTGVWLPAGQAQLGGGIETPGSSRRAIPFLGVVSEHMRPAIAVGRRIDQERAMTRRRIPETEREAIFDREDGICHYCGQKISAGHERWDIEHVIPLELGGTEEKMDENLRLIHSRPCHVRKTRDDVAAIAKSKRMRRRAKGIGRTAKSKILGSLGTGWKRKIDGTVERR